MFSSLPDIEAVKPVAGRGEEVRDRLRALTHIGHVGKAIRTHGDYHLGQALWTTERRLADPRLRGRAGPLRARAPAQALAAARRRGDAALLRVRGLGVRDPERHRGARGLGGGVPLRLPRRLSRHDRAGAAAAGAGGDPPPADRVRAREGRLRAPLRARQPAGVGLDPGRRDPAHAGATHEARRAGPASRRRGAARAHLRAARRARPRRGRLLRGVGAERARRRGRRRLERLGRQGRRARADRLLRDLGGDRARRPPRATATSSRCTAPTGSSASRPIRSRSSPRCRPRRRPRSTARRTSGPTTRGSSAGAWRSRCRSRSRSTRCTRSRGASGSAGSSWRSSSSRTPTTSASRTSSSCR